MELGGAAAGEVQAQSRVEVVQLPFARQHEMSELCYCLLTSLEPDQGTVVSRGA